MEANKFRYDISFLRAFSVLAVLFYHYKFPWFKSGFIGVDIFFVISGYLMTKIILSSFDKGNFNLWNFYSRRVIRIIPALLALIIIFTILIFIFLQPQIVFFLRSAFSSILFFSNIYYYLNNGYFDASSQYNFLLHSWSLSVEWQFYLIYPIILLLLKKIYNNQRTKFTIIFLLLVSISFLSMLLHNINDTDFSFYIFYPRAWEMMLGGLAFLFEEKSQKIPSKIKLVVALLCLSVLGCFIFLFYISKWPSSYAIIPVFFTALLICMNYEFRIYKNKASIYLGNISYSLYLYHWPFYVFLLFFEVNINLKYRILTILLSFVFAILSYEFVEKRDYSKKTSSILAMSMIAFIISFSITKIDAKNYTEEYQFINVASNYKFSKAAEKQYKFNAKHLLYNKDYQSFIKHLDIPVPDKKNIILLGDSHAGMFSKTLHNIFSGIKNSNLIQITADATYPMENSKSAYENPVKYFNYVFTQYIPKYYKSIDLIIINANYSGYSEEEIKKNIQLTEKYYSKYNLPTIYIGMTDIYVIDYPTYNYIKKKYNANMYVQEKDIKENQNFNVFLKRYLGKKYIDLLDQNIEKVSSDSFPYMYDTNHLTLFGTEQYKNILTQKIHQSLEQYCNYK
ncbi:Peptidoglycan/LPS O-acetylase OafA/YrhL, contains acyltransferase and SGNH-hydrolase domains [Chryseobacterium taeanense]|uniref:Peptidoglycan/LPS O-acetylase OafA/YrhL, contains acyltransferase and SGNH-hydrolase domains n=1 Tax=Chryseobacterium taeanense TaxID=311334 RepID=A0A1G8H5I8_9FLAO|nr:acyltransferase family protein [Chryseobacterium taeanense]SDI01924.1 Peptidoglycan/LPS O-acetylase OafA/YrhL, contains acyltransferase and SGNH-hydrolase domains [Chryseobacterium taeanense]